MANYYFFSSLSISVGVLTICFSVLTSVFILFLAKHRHAQAIKSHAIQFVCLSLCGALLLSLALFTWPLQPNATMCAVRPWAFSLPVYILLCPLIAKHYRIHRIFNTSQFKTQRWGVSDQHVLIMIIVMVCPQVVINIVWSILAPLTLPDETEDCYASSECSMFAWLSIGYICLLLCGTVWLTITLHQAKKRQKEKKASEEYNHVMADAFNQSKDIVSCAAIIIGATSVLVALQTAGTAEKETRFAIRSFGLLLVLLVWEAIIMVPKIRAVIQEQRHENELITPHSTGPATLPLTAAAKKQIQGYNINNNKDTQKMPRPDKDREALKEKDATLIDMTDPLEAQIRQKNKRPALSSLFTFMSPAEEKQQEQESINTQATNIQQDTVLAITDEGSATVTTTHTGKAADNTTHPLPPSRPRLPSDRLDINMPGRGSIVGDTEAESTDTQTHTDINNNNTSGSQSPITHTPLPSGPPPPVPHSDASQSPNVSPNVVPAPASSSSSSTDSSDRDGHSSLPGHFRSKSYAAGLLSNNGNNTFRRHLNSALAHHPAVATERLPSLKAVRQGNTEANTTGVGRQPGTNRYGFNSSHTAFKANFEDHVSPLYTPAAITVEPVPFFTQE